MFKRVLLSTSVLFALGGAALAADLPVAAPAETFVPEAGFSWTGFYIGGHGGYVFGDDSEITTEGNNPATIANVGALARPPEVSLDDQEGFIGGGQIGYNYQVGQFVFGIEADISYTDFEGDTSYFSPTTFGAALAGTQSDFSQSLEYLGTVRGRLGYAFDRFMVYGTGGFAYGEVENQATFFNSAGAVQFFGESSEIQTGYTVGGGLEYAVTDNITIRGEYLYFDLGEETVEVVNQFGTGTSYNSEFEMQGHIVRGAVNFKFAGF